MKLTVKLDFGGGNVLKVGTFSEIPHLMRWTAKSRSI